MLSATTLPPAARAAFEAEAVAIETPEDLRPRPLVSRTWSGVLRNRLEVSVVAIFLPDFPIILNRTEHVFAGRVQPSSLLLLQMPQNAL